MQAVHSVPKLETRRCIFARAAHSGCSPEVIFSFSMLDGFDDPVDLPPISFIWSIRLLGTTGLAEHRFSADDWPRGFFWEDEAPVMVFGMGSWDVEITERSGSVD